jgi:predicted DCC family thiol-disulfide oxidoreductase YuxK
VRLTVLYDAGCPLCTRFREWLAGQPVLVPLDLVPVGSAEARRRFPTLDHARAMEEITVVGNDGSVWTGPHAWVMCLWATVAHRGLAERLARPAGLPLARAAACTAAGLRHVLARSPAEGGDYPDRCAGACSPSREGISEG